MARNPGPRGSPTGNSTERPRFVAGSDRAGHPVHVCSAGSATRARPGRRTGRGCSEGRRPAPDRDPVRTCSASRRPANGVPGRGEVGCLPGSRPRSRSSWTGRRMPGTEIGAAPVRPIDAMHPDVIGINRATGPEGSGQSTSAPVQHKHPRSVAQRGLRCRWSTAMHYDLTRRGLGRPQRRFVEEPASRSSAAAAAPRPTTRRHGAEPRACDPAPSSTSRPWCRSTPPSSCCTRTGSRRQPDRDRRAHQRQRLQEVPWAMLAGRLGHLRTDGHHQVKGPPVLDLSASTTSAATAPATWTRSPAASPPRPRCPLVLDSTEPGRSTRGPASSGSAAGAILGNSANLRTAARGPGSTDRFAANAPYGGGDLRLHRRGGPGPRRRVEGPGRPPHPDLAVEPLRPRARRPHLRRPSRSLLSTGDDDLRRRRHGPSTRSGASGELRGPTTLGSPT